MGLKYVTFITYQSWKKNFLQNIEWIIEKQNSKQVARNRPQLKVSIDAVKWLVFQGCTFRGRDEVEDSRNRGNFLELIKLMTFYDDDVGAIVLQNAPQNAQCVSSTFVDKEGFIRERFFNLVHVKDTTSLALKNAICELLLYHCLHVDDIRGQGYESASNIRDEWNGLQALFAKMCRFAYYVHWLAYRLQLTLAVASKEQRHNQLKDIEAFHIAELIGSGQLEIGKGKNQVDILNTMQLVSSTKTLLQKFREYGWDHLFDKVKLSCKVHEIEFPNLSVSYKTSRGRSCIQRSNLTIQHQYRFDIFIVGIDSLLTEMNSRFNNEVMKLLVLSSTLDPCDNYKAFRVEDICKLMNDFYLDDFMEQEKLHMKIQLGLQKASIVVKLCQVLAKTNNSSIYPLLVSTAITERAFSAIKIVKTMFHNRMEDDFLSTYLVAYIEKDIDQEFSTNSIIDEFDLMKNGGCNLGCLFG
ncbi:hypothetical protein V6Z12_A06G077200 [Gossypium hirsutum]